MGIVKRCQFSQMTVMVEFLQELGSGQVGQLGGLSLRDDALGVPLNRGGNAHLAREFAG